MRASCSACDADTGLHPLLSRSDHERFFRSSVASDVSILAVTGGLGVASPSFAPAATQSMKPGIGERVTKVLSDGISVLSFSATRLIRKFPIETPRKPGSQLLME